MLWHSHVHGMLSLLHVCVCWMDTTEHKQLLWHHLIPLSRKANNKLEWLLSTQHNNLMLFFTTQRQEGNTMFVGQLEHRRLVGPAMHQCCTVSKCSWPQLQYTPYSLTPPPQNPFPRKACGQQAAGGWHTLSAFQQRVASVTQKEWHNGEPCGWTLPHTVRWPNQETRFT